MRVISGKFKGTNLVNFSNKNVRPTSDRVKETIFNILMGELEESRVLDLFGGTGNLSIEALSRGAKTVDCVELNSSSIKIIKANLKKIGNPTEISLCQKDVFRFLAAHKGPAYDLIFIDPPFTEKLADRVLSEVSKSLAFGENTRIIIEATKHEEVKDRYNSLVCSDLRKFGDKNLFFFSKEQ